MQRCIELARLGAGNTAPNPMVGAVLVHHDRIIGEGYHVQYGEAHAEVNCINNIAEKDRHLLAESTIYVSLEPCSHYGKTPPCADLIIRMQIPKVVIGCRDSFEKVNGSGIEKLQAASVEVEYGIMEEECRELNKCFFTFHEKQRPYIILKWAQSADGKIAGRDGEQIKISNEFTDRQVHRWRSEEAGILVGVNTALKDNPSLTARLWPGKSPVRILLDDHLQVPGNFNIYNEEAPVIVFNKMKSGTEGNTLFIKNTGGTEELMKMLYNENVSSVIVEGGAKTLQHFIDEGNWDEARVITNTKQHIGQGIQAPVLTNFALKQTKSIFSDNIDFYTRK